MDIQTGTVDVNGTQIYYEIAGSGDPVVFIHGFTLDTRMWDDQFEVFAQHYRVIRYDVRGFGQSALPTGTPYSRADDLNALLDYLGIPQAHLVGLSMGGAIAVNLALTQPDKVRTLILVDAVIDGFTSDDLNASLGSIVTQAQSTGGRAANEIWLKHPLFLPAHENPEVSTRLSNIIGENSGWHWENQDPAQSLDPTAFSRLHEIPHPTLIVVGEHDEPYIQSLADVLRQQVPRSSFLALSNAGHMANMEAPQPFNDAVLAFLQSHTTGRVE